MATNRTKPTETGQPFVHRCSLTNGTPIDIALIGCGGNGSQMLYKLARLHWALRELGRAGLFVTVFDPDTVSPANIGRQLFSPDDVGLHKSIVLVNRLNMSYGLLWESLPTKFNIGMRANQRPIDPDIIVTCVDTAAARRELWQAMHDAPDHLRPRYWLDLGNTRDAGQVIVGQVPGSEEIVAPNVPVQDWVAGGARLNAQQHLQRARLEMEAKRLPCVTEVFPQLLDRRRKEDNSPSCSLAEALEKQSLFVNDQMSTWGAQLLDGLLREGALEYHGVFINLKTGAVRPLACRERVLEVKPARSKATKRRAA